MAMPPKRAKIGVKAIIIREQQLLTVVKQYPEGVFYILPGGSQNHGETLEAAIVRECHEELGIAVTVEQLLFVREYIGAHHQFAALDSQIHIVDIMFACTIPADYIPQLGPEPDPDQIGVAWLPLASLPEYRFYPAALQRYLLYPQATTVYIGDIN
jgi:ADP-ribose pyrophosphatase YjhB (NUDIX family)